MATTEEKKKMVRTMIVLGGVILLLLVVLIVLNASKKRKAGASSGTADDASPVSIIAEPKVSSGQGLISSKMEAYATAPAPSRHSEGIEDLWASLETKKDSEAKAGEKEPADGRSIVDQKMSSLDEETPGKAPAGASATKPTAASKPKPKPRPAAPAEAPVEEKPAARAPVGWGGSEYSQLSDAGRAPENTMDPVKVMFTKNETIKSGQRVTLRLLEPLVIDGVRLGANTHLMATCTIGAGRLQVTVNGFSLNGKIYAVNLVGYDSDGSEGIYCPAASAEQSVNMAKNAATSMASGALSSLVGSALSTVVSTGSAIAQSSGSKITVTVPSGYQFYLVNQAQAEE